MQLAARIFAVLCALMMSVNALFMMISPRAWFGLPSWLRAAGVLTEDKYAQGGRSILIRILGALILLLVGGVTFDILMEAAKR